MHSPSGGSVWPLFDLAIRTPRLTLRFATDADLQRLALFRPQRVISAGEEPFDGVSSFYMGSPAAEWSALTGEWSARARTSPEWWHLSLAVLVDDEVVGQQNITAADFAHVRTVNSFSFLARDHQGRGIGKEMRAAVLHLAFAGLGALRAESDAFADNPASLGVSRALGYQPNGTTLALRPSGRSLMLRYLLTRDQWEHHRRRDIVIEGLAACLPLLGIDDADAELDASR
jgi:RimJ/RimL family protein N-acetyltransferase